MAIAQDAGPAAAVVEVTARPSGTTVAQQAIGTIVSRDGLTLVPAELFRAAGTSPVVGAQPQFLNPRAVRVSVRLPDGSVRAAAFLAADARSGLAAIKIDAASGLTALTPSASRKVTSGEPAGVLIPFGEAIPCAVGQYVQGVDAITQHFVPLHQVLLKGTGTGLAGAPLVNAKGELIGILRANESLKDNVPGSRQGQSTWYAIRGKLVARVAEGLSKSPYEVAHPWIGLMVGNSPTGAGAVVRSVTLGGPASRMGLLPGDVIVEADGKPVRGSGDFAEVVFQQEVGGTMRMVVKRGGASVRVNVQVTTAGSNLFF